MRVFNGLILGAMICVLPATMVASKPVKNQADVEQTVHDYLVAHPEVLLEASKSLEAQGLQQSVTKQASALFFSPNSPTIGKSNANIAVVEFFDYQCGYCRKLTPVLLKANKNDPQTKMIFKELPIFGEVSVMAAKAALASNKQGKYLPMHQHLMMSTPPLNQDKIVAIAKELQIDLNQLQKDMASPDVQQELQQNLKLADELNIRGTPALVIAKVKGNAKTAQVTPKSIHMMLGAVSDDELKDYVQQARSV